MSYFNWPACVAVVAVVAMLRFHEQVGRMFDRIKSLGIKGAIFGPAKQEPGKELAVAPSNAEKLLHGWDNPILVEHEKNLRQYMDGLNIADHAERERVLIRFLASAHIGQSFDRIYYNLRQPAARVECFERKRGGTAKNSRRSILRIWKIG